MMSASVKFVQLNQKKAYVAAVELNKALKKVPQYICLITEPYKNKCKVTARPEGCQVHVVKSQIPPRAAIFFKGNMNIIQIDSLSNEDCVVSLWNNGKDSVILASIYLDINKPVESEWMDKIVNYASSKGLPVILGVDTNAHSVLFGHESNKKRNRVLHL